MTEVIIFIAKVVIIAAIAFFLGCKTGLFSMNKAASAIVFLIMFLLCGTEIYMSLFKQSIVLKIIFESEYKSFALDLSFFLRIFLFSLSLGLVCSAIGIKLSVTIHTVRDLCALALLIAITALLGIYATIRFGNAIKIPFKFIPVFITAALFGPVWGGIVGALADITAFFINPVGGIFMPQITFVEFLYGFTYGLFFFNMKSWNGFKTMLRIILCVVFQIAVINLGLTTYFLVPLMNMTFNKLLIVRSASGVANMAIQLIIITIMSKYISAFRKMIK